MAYFRYTINDDFSIADNSERNITDNWNKLRRMTSATEMYCVHILSGSCHLDINGHEVELGPKDFLVLMQGCFIRTIDHSEDLTYIIHSGFISGYQNRYGDNLKPPTNVYHRMTA